MMTMQGMCIFHHLLTLKILLFPHFHKQARECFIEYARATGPAYAAGDDAASVASTRSYESIPPTSSDDESTEEGYSICERSDSTGPTSSQAEYDERDPGEVPERAFV